MKLFRVEKGFLSMIRWIHRVTLLNGFKVKSSVDSRLKSCWSTDQLENPLDENIGAITLNLGRILEEKLSEGLFQSKSSTSSVSEEDKNVQKVE